MKVWSIFTSDFNVCAVTHIYRGARRIEVHHIFGGANRKKSTEDGFTVPLIAEIHPNGASASDTVCKEFTGMTLKQLDTMLKQRCQEHWESQGRSREEFIERYGKNYL